MCVCGGGGGGQLGQAKSKGGKAREMFENFIPEVAANASNFKNQLTHMENSSINTFFCP